jgi:hypothetical protein
MNVGQNKDKTDTFPNVSKINKKGNCLIPVKTKAIWAL